MRIISRLISAAFTAVVLLVSLTLAILAMLAKGVLWLDGHKHMRVLGSPRRRVHRQATAHH